MAIEDTLGKGEELEASDKNLAKSVSELPLTADDSVGTFIETKPEDELFKEPDVETKTGKVTEKFGEYSKELFKDLRQHPDQYLVETSRGKMTIREAFEAGWDPATDTFGEEQPSPDEEAMLSGLPEGEQESMRAFLDPSQHEPPDAVREQLGMAPTAPPQGAPPPAMDAAAPEGMPDGEADPLAAMLGGGNA